MPSFVAKPGPNTRRQPSTLRTRTGFYQARSSQVFSLRTLPSLHKARSWTRCSLPSKTTIPLSSLVSAVGQAKWATIHAHQYHFRTYTDTLATTYSTGHLSHRQIVHRWPSTYFRRRCLPLWGRTGLVPSNILSMSLLSSHPGNLHGHLCLWDGQSRPTNDCLFFGLQSSTGLWKIIPLGHWQGLPTPSRIYFGQEKESLSKWPSHHLNLWTHLFQLIPVACPDHFASGDVYTILYTPHSSASSSNRRWPHPDQPRPRR